MKNSADLSVKYYSEHFNCAESVLKAVTEKLNITNDAIPQIATGFGGGMANTNGRCGALVGGILAINFALGRKSNAESNLSCNEAVSKLIYEFQKKFNVLNCNDLTGCNLSTETGKEDFKKPERRTACFEFVKFTAAITEKLLLSE